MSEKLLKFFLSELKTVRLVCHGTREDTGTPCGLTMEMPIEQLASIFPHNSCKEPR